MGALWAPVYLPLCDSPVLGLAVAVQEGFQSPRHYFTFNLIPPLYSLTFENRSRSCREETAIHLTLRGRLWKGEHNWAEGSRWQKFLILNWAKKAFLLSGASWHSSCYFSSGFSFLLANCITCLMWVWTVVSGVGGRESGGNSWCLHQAISIMLLFRVLRGRVVEELVVC